MNTKPHKKLKIAITSSNTIDAQSTYGICKRIGTLADTLVALGETVTVFAYYNSKTQAKVYIEERFKTDIIPHNEPDLSACALLEKSQDFDIIHANNTIPILLNTLSRAPIVYSIAWGEYTLDEINFFRAFSNVFYIAQSEYVKQANPDLSWIDVIYNGVNVSTFCPVTKPSGEYLLFLGRIVENKGAHFLVNAARITGDTVIIAGQIEDQEYFDTMIQPFLNDTIQYIGEANFQEKITLLQNAKALVNPGMLRESCSNVILEALACGTPVIARDAGSNAELVTDGKTGLIFTTDNELPTKINEISNIDRTACRTDALARFSDTVYAQRHQEVYKKIISQWKKRT